jgi:hypothetical protein
MSGLVSRIRGDTFPVPTSDWLDCVDPSTPVKCAMTWAVESNAWTCDYVYSQIYNNTDHLTSGYAEGAFPIVELQISKSALRLGNWLNRLTAGDYYSQREIVLQTVPSWVDGPSGGA